MSKLIDTLMQKIPFFWQFTPEERQILSDHDSFFYHYNEGAFLIKQGARDASLYILIKGSVRVVKQDEDSDDIADGHYLTTLKNGSVFGEISFLTDRPRSTHIIADEEVTAFKVDDKALKSLNPMIQSKIKDQLISILVQRLDEMNKALMTIMR